VELMQIRTADRAPLEALAAQSDRVGRRARIVVLAGGGLATSDVATMVGCAPATVRLWCRRYQRAGVAGLLDRPRSGRPVDVSEVLVLTMTAGLGAAAGRTSWTARALAAQLDISPHTVLRVWRRWGLATRRSRHPHLPSPGRDLVRMIAETRATVGILWDAPRLVVAVSLEGPPRADPRGPLLARLTSHGRLPDDWAVDAHDAEHREFVATFEHRGDVAFLGCGSMEQAASADWTVVPPAISWADLLELVAACQGFAAGEPDALASAVRFRKECERLWPDSARVLMWLAE